MSRSFKTIAAIMAHSSTPKKFPISVPKKVSLISALMDRHCSYMRYGKNRKVYAEQKVDERKSRRMKEKEYSRNLMSMED